MGKKKPSMTKTIKDIFKAKTQVTLSDLYKTLSENPDITKTVNQNVLKHRIRSCIYSLSQSNVIERTADATYKIKK